MCKDTQKYKTGTSNRITFFSSRGASISSLQRRSITWMASSSLLYSLTVSLATNMGIRGHVGNLLSYAYKDGERRKQSSQLIPEGERRVPSWTSPALEGTASFIPFEDGIESSWRPHDG